MFSGDHEIRSDKEVLKRDMKFLLQNNVSPIPVSSVRIPMISMLHDMHVNLELYAGQVSQKIGRVIDFSLPHEILETTSHQWQESDEHQTKQLIQRMCNTIGNHVLRVGSPQEELFAFMGFKHRPIFRNGKNKDIALADIVYGIKTRLGDGGRYDDGGGKTSFDQRKGTWTRSVHMYIRTTPK